MSVCVSGVRGGWRVSGCVFWWGVNGWTNAWGKCPPVCAGWLTGWLPDRMTHWIVDWRSDGFYPSWLVGDACGLLPAFTGYLADCLPDGMNHRPGGARDGLSLWLSDWRGMRVLDCLFWLTAQHYILESFTRGVRNLLYLGWVAEHTCGLLTD